MLYVLWYIYHQFASAQVKHILFIFFQVGVIVTVNSPSVFQLVFRYINRNLETVPAEVIVTPDDPAEEVQASTVSFPSTGRYDGTSYVLVLLFAGNLLSFVNNKSFNIY